MTKPRQKRFTCLGDKKVFIYILVYFYRFLNASTIIKIRNHLARFTSHSSRACLRRRGWRNEIIQVFSLLFFFPKHNNAHLFLIPVNFRLFNALIINSRPNSGTLISGKIACSMKLNFRYRINAQSCQPETWTEKKYKLNASFSFHYSVRRGARFYCSAFFLLIFLLIVKTTQNHKANRRNKTRENRMHKVNKNLLWFIKHRRKKPEKQ